MYGDYAKLGKVPRQAALDTLKVESSMVKAPTKKFCYSAEFVDSVVKQCSRDFVPKRSGFLKHKDGTFDPFSLHVFHPPAFLGFWASLREIILVKGEFTRGEKEILATFVSKSNASVFCINAHMLAAKSQGVDYGLLKRAVLTMCPLALKDKRLSRIVNWCLAAQTRGVPQFLEKPPVAESEIPEVLGAAFFFNYINRVVDTFITRDSLLPSMPALLRFFMKRSQKISDFMEDRLVRKVFGAIKGPCCSGDSANLMHQDPVLPKSLAWAAKNKSIARALAYWAWAINEMAMIYIPAKLQVFVKNYICHYYTGTDEPLKQDWALGVAEAVNGTAAEKFAVAFMLLVAFNRFEIDDQMLHELEKHYPNHRTRQAFGIFSAFEAASTISFWQSMKFMLQ